MATSPLLAKAPCLNCRASHQRCDKRKPVCRRCEMKGLDCQPVQRKTVFRHGSTANFDANFGQAQTWVNSRPKRWRPAKSSSKSGPLESHDPGSPGMPYLAHDDLMNSPRVSNESEPEYPSFTPINNDNQHSTLLEEAPQNQSPHRSVLFNQSHQGHVLDQSSPFQVSASPHSSLNSNFHSHVSTGSQQRTGNELHSSGVEASASPSSNNQVTTTPLGTIQESCLLKYFIEEISPWFDHCDDLHHFQLVVPRRARHCSTLLNAICAVAALHLSRLSKYKTTQGVLYCGQLLPNLTQSSALEYMLKCIPDLIRFPEIQDPIHQENIMAATVILRQYEEMEEELDGASTEGNFYLNGRVNFLAITHTIIDSMIASPLDQPLATAAYWITVRQEIYYALTREATPYLRFDADLWRNPSVASNMILFTGQVAMWRWGQQQADEWARLKDLEQELIQNSIGELEPILDLPADRRKGEVFPTIWYSLDVQVTAIQHFRLAQMILTAENPHLEGAARAVHRKTEAQVRSIVLCICGIGLQHSRVQPALLNAVIAITLYGEYFTDPMEREALVDIIKRARDFDAWPMAKPYQTLQHRWDIMDSAEV